MLKNRSGDSLEDISRKLELFHNYKDSIDAAKQKYNNEQMFHILDEAKEKGEKIAEAAEDMKPKTAEERREEQAEEAIDDMKSEASDKLTESIEEITEDVEEMLEEVTEKITEELKEQQIEEKLSQEEQILTSNAGDLSAESENLPTQVFTEESLLEEGLTKQEKDLALLEYYKKQGYKPVNYYV